MNQLWKQGVLAGIILTALPLAGAKAGMLTLDNFDEYTSASYIQNQQGTNGKFSRFGTAVSDGLYSSTSAGNNGTSGAVANAAFTAGSATQYGAKLTLTNTTSLSSTGSATISLDVKVTSSPILANLAATIEVQDANGETYQAAATSLAADSTYQTFNFNFSPGAVTIAANPVPADTLAYVLANTTAVTILFTDTADTGKQNIDFDNLVAASGVPEPSTWVMGVATLGFATFSTVRKQLRSRRGA